MQLNNVSKDFLERRHITEDVMNRFSLYTNEDGLIVIPILNIEGNIIFNKYRRSPLKDDGPKYFYDKGSKVSLYGIHEAKSANKIVVTEGELDTLVLWSHNIPAVSSTGGAMSFQEEWCEFFKDKEVILCFDNDKAGGDGMVKALKIVPHAKIVFVPDKPNVKDLSDYVANGGNIHALIDTAKSLNTLELVEEDRGSRLALWQSTHFHDSFIHEHRKPVRENKENRSISGDKVERARAYPISNLVDLRANKTRCLFHKERTASLTYYPKTNSLYCFGKCGKRYDAIDVYRKLTGCSFKEAVKFLSQ